MDWTTTLGERGGIASLGQLLGAGATAEELGRRVRDGRLFRPRRGVYALPTAPGSAVAAVRAGGRLSCLPAAGTYGLWAGQEARLHVTVPAKATRLAALDDRSVRHWGTRGESREVWRVSVADCLRSVVRCAPTEDAVAVLDTALSSRLVSLAGLPVLFDTEPNWTRAIVRLARPGAESGVESLARQRLERRGHHVEQQLHVRGAGRVDMRVDGRLLVELDGYAFHSDRDAFERDRHRDAELVRRGHRVLRFSARQVLQEWRQVESAIEAALAVPENVRDAPLRMPELRSLAS